MGLSADADEDPPQEIETAAAHSAMAVTEKFKRLEGMLSFLELKLFKTCFVTMA
jgi:hypothetical protein